MKLLLAAATEQEISTVLKHLNKYWKKEDLGTFHLGSNSLQVYTHGVGMMATTYHLTKLFQKEHFDFAIQAGIAGSYNREIQLGEVLMINEETLGDLGAEDHLQFLDLFELDLAKKNALPFLNGKMKMPITVFHEKINLRKASGLTVNTVAGSSFTANNRNDKFHCDVESMEGAAFHFVCISEKIPFVQLRSISNYVEARDKSKWKIKEAIESLSKELIKLLENF